MGYLAVNPDGTTATVTSWDEGGSNVMVFKKDGSIQSAPRESGTGSWGRMSMIGVALDSQFTYQLLTQDGCSGNNTLLNSNKLPQYPACGDNFTWKTIRRYNLLTGAPAPFSLGYGFMGDMLLVHSGAGDLKGISIYKNELFVSDESGDSVRVYNKTTMSSVPLRKFKFEGGIGQLSPDNTGGMWMLQANLNKIICFNRSTGVISGQPITFPSGVVPSAFFVDTLANRILVADNGINQNIRIYTKDGSGNFAYSSSFGTQGGIFSGVAGKYAPLKLFDIQGVGADAHGNIYVANSNPGGGAILQAYKPDGTLMWDKKGSIFQGTACPDPLHAEDVYTYDKRVKIDYSKTTPGSEWSFDAYTLNRFKYPDDPRLRVLYCSSWIKYINGQKFLFATDLYDTELAGFRFSPSTDGEVAIPCFLMNIEAWDTQSTYPTTLGSQKDFIWMDKNGDGTIQSDEFSFNSRYDNPVSMSVWVDSSGNIWKGIRESGVRFIPLKEVNSAGVPIYDFADSKVLDIANAEIGVDGVKRLVYDRDSDELFISGFSNQKPDQNLAGTKVDTWWSMGSTVCMYKDVLKTLTENPAVNFKNIVPNWRIFIPFAADWETGFENTGKSFTVGGDYMFTALYQNGNINVYKRSNGEYQGQISPGAEVGKLSGWTDINYSINVLKTPTEYLIFNEEDLNAKVLMYRVKSLATNDQLLPDLVPYDFKILNSTNDTIDHLETNQPIHFSLKVSNQGPGLVLAGSTFANGRSFLIKYMLKDLTTGSSTVLLVDTCKLALPSGESLQFTTRAVPGVVKEGEFSISALVNPSLGSNIKECVSSNNILEMALTVIPVTSVENIKDTKASSLNIYPVPASNMIYIKELGSAGSANLSIVNWQGQMVYTRDINGEGVIKQDVSKLSPGIYFLKISSIDKIYRGKFMVVGGN